MHHFVQNDIFSRHISAQLDFTFTRTEYPRIFIPSLNYFLKIFGLWDWDWIGLDLDFIFQNFHISDITEL